MPRKRKPKPELDQSLVTEIVTAMTDEHPELTTADRLPRQLPDPRLDAEPPAPDREALRHRPITPRPRNGEPAASFASDEIRIIKDGHMWQMQSSRDLTGEEKDRLAASGFEAVDNDERYWNASQRELAAHGTDINIVAVALGKPTVAGRGR